MDVVPLWVLLLCLGALGTLVTFGLYILKDHISRDAEVHKQVAVHDHIIQKIEGHESRLTKVETQVDTTILEVSKIRDMRHDILDDVSHKLSGWYLDIIKMIKGEK